mmetsp:Transcript_1337/g.2170  ORF Transcript_1337/g.2170 Transcript_1337/m.2170 type:complete len:133 (-) Transcript_1337:38-436(-)
MSPRNHYVLFAKLETTFCIATEIAGARSMQSASILTKMQQLRKGMIGYALTVKRKGQDVLFVNTMLAFQSLNVVSMKNVGSSTIHIASHTPLIIPMNMVLKFAHGMIALMNIVGKPMKSHFALVFDAQLLFT